MWKIYPLFWAWFSIETTGFFLVAYARLPQSFNLLKPQPQAHIQICISNQQPVRTKSFILYFSVIQFTHNFYNTAKLKNYIFKDCVNFWFQEGMNMSKWSGQLDTGYTDWMFLASDIRADMTIRSRLNTSKDIHSLSMLLNSFPFQTVLTLKKKNAVGIHTQGIICMLKPLEFLGNNHTLTPKPLSFKRTHMGLTDPCWY